MRLSASNYELRGMQLILVENLKMVMFHYTWASKCYITGFFFFPSRSQFTFVPTF